MWKKIAPYINYIMIDGSQDAVGHVMAVKTP